MDLNLQDKIIIVTGGAKGIGEAISKTLAAEGAFVIIVGRNEDDNSKTVNEIIDAGGKADAVKAELTIPSACKEAIDYAVEKYKRIDGLVNNAGINDGIGLEKGNYENFMASLHRNLVHYY